LVPFWAKDTKIGYSLINAKAETVAEKPAFRDAFKSRRCLIAADGFYEWVRHEVVRVIVRRIHPAGPAVPSAVKKEPKMLSGFRSAVGTGAPFTPVMGITAVGIRGDLNHLVAHTEHGKPESLP
jgi:hypothetical protein